jgi:hypothetical protein
MSYEVDDEDRSIGGACDATQEPTTSKAIDSNEASKIANMLEGLRFPATKEQIRKYVAEGRAIALSVANARNTSRYIDDNLQDGRKYNNTYEIERALGLVVKRNNAQSRNRDRAGKKTSKERNGKRKYFSILGIKR